MDITRYDYVVRSFLIAFIVSRPKGSGGTPCQTVGSVYNCELQHLIAVSSSSREALHNFAFTKIPSSFQERILFKTAQAANSQIDNSAPGLIVLRIMTIDAGPGYVTNTVAAPVTGVASVGSLFTADDAFPEGYETSRYRVIDGSHLELSLLRVHPAGATIMVGG